MKQSQHTRHYRTHKTIVNKGIRNMPIPVEEIEEMDIPIYSGDKQRALSFLKSNPKTAYTYQEIAGDLGIDISSKRAKNLQSSLASMVKQRQLMGKKAISNKGRVQVHYWYQPTTESGQTADSALAELMG